MQPQESDTQLEETEEPGTQSEEREELDTQSEEGQEARRDPSQWSDSGDEATVQDILDILKDRSVSNESDDSGYLDNLFDNSKDPSDVLIEDKLSQLDKTSKDISLEGLGLETFNVNLLKGFHQLEFLFLQDNKISSLPYEFFAVLGQLKYLDLRNNRLVTLPSSVCYHPCLEVLLLQNNYIQRVPKELGSLPKLRGLQISFNPIRYPSPSVVREGSRAILDFLRQEWTRYESSTTFEKHQQRGSAVPANSVDITPKDDPINEENRHTRNQGKTASRITDSAKNRTPKFTPEGPSTSGVYRGQTAAFESINYKDDPVCMVVKKIQTDIILKSRKDMHLPSCIEENNDTWSTSQISSESIAKSDGHKPVSTEEPPSGTTWQHRRRRKLQHYSQILNGYEPFQSMSKPPDDIRLKAMYLRRLGDVNRKFVAHCREKELQRMKDKRMLSDWREEYVALRDSTWRDPDGHAVRKSQGLISLYGEAEMMTKQELIDSRLEKIRNKSQNKPLRDPEGEKSNFEARMTEMQRTWQYLESKLNSHKSKWDSSSQPGKNMMNDAADSSGDKTFSAASYNDRSKMKFWSQEITEMQKMRQEIKRLAHLNDSLM